MLISIRLEKGIYQGEGSPVEVGVLLHHRNNSGQSWAGTDCRVAGMLHHQLFVQARVLSLLRDHWPSLRGHSALGRRKMTRSKNIDLVIF